MIDSPRRYSYGFGGGVSGGNYGGVRPKYSNHNISSRQTPSRRSSSSTGVGVRTISRYSYDFRDQYQHQHPQRNEGDDEFMVVEQDEQLELENEFQEIEFRSHPSVPAPNVAVPRVSGLNLIKMIKGFAIQFLSVLLFSAAATDPGIDE